MLSVISSIKRLFQLIVVALRGSEQEFTTGGINRAIFVLSVPMILEMGMEGVFAVVDMFFVSKISTNAVATVGLTESILYIIYSVAVGLSMALTAIVARRIGEKDPERAANAAFQGILISSAIAIVLGVLGLFFAEDILRLMGGEEDMIQEGKGYTKIMFGFNISIVLIFVINSIFRGAGNASIAMRALILSNCLNIVLDPLLIFGWGPVPAFGIEGAAIATTIGRSIGVVYQMSQLFKGNSIIKLTIKNVVLRMKTVVEILKVAIGGMGQFLIESASWIILVRIVSMFGTEAVAGYQISMRVIFFTILPAWGMSNAVATLVGQNLGAKQPDRAEKTVWLTARYCMVFLGIIAVVFFQFADEVASIFTKEAAVIAIARSALQVICLGYLFFAYGMAITQAFNGAGDTKTPMVVNVIVFWLFQIPFAYLTAVHFDLREVGVFISIAVAHSIHAVVCLFIFRKGKWKEKKV